MRKQRAFFFSLLHQCLPIANKANRHRPPHLQIGFSPLHICVSFFKKPKNTKQMEKLFSLQVFVSAVVAVIVALMLYAYFNKPAASASASSSTDSAASTTAG